MASEKVVYWLAVAVMAVTLFQSVPMDRPNWVGELQNRVLELADCATVRAMGYLDVAEMRVGMQSSRYARAQAVGVRMQAQFARVESVMARQQAGLARLEAGRARMEARAECAQSAMERQEMHLSF